MKVKKTKNGNTKITLTTDQVQALWDLLGGTNKVTRTAAIAAFHGSPNYIPWTQAKDIIVYSIGRGLSRYLREEEVKNGKT